MLLLGCKPTGRHTEQHDTFFAIGDSLKSLVPRIKDFWPDAGTIHVDAWREVTNVDGYAISVSRTKNPEQLNKLFFINLGGYRKNEFDEFHYKLLAVAPDKGKAVRQSRETAFYRHTGFKSAESHIDDKYGIDVDDIHNIADIIPENVKSELHVQIALTPDAALPGDEIHLGYFQLKDL